MILYNVTVNIDKEVENEWMDWMKHEHIPQVMNTGCFVENRFYRLMVDDEGGTTYAIQYLAETMGHIEAYQQNFAKQLQVEHSQRFKDRFVVFRTLLEMV